jgi:hypothetical protein
MRAHFTGRLKRPSSLPVPHPLAADNKAMKISPRTRATVEGARGAIYRGEG